MGIPGRKNVLDIDRPPRRKIARRAWLGGLGLGAAGIGAGLVYRAAPGFWKQYANQIGHPVEPAPARPNPAAWPDRGLFATWLGHSTVLLKLDGFTILTDPVLSSWVGLNFGPFTLGMKRLVAPAISLEGLPRIDLVLLSHAHMDHFDLPTLRALEAQRPLVVTARATSDLLRVPGYAGVQEVGWQETVQAGPAAIRGLQVRHWGARMRSDTWRGYNGYLIQVGRHRVLFGGDTAMTDHFRAVGGAHLALMPIGAYRPWIANHCNPEQAWSMANDARADLILPIHHRTFTLSQEPPGEPMERLLSAAGASHSDRIPVRKIGGELRLS
jgi:L-ascorbate metabolism protein UlaG (beta-lactamase superfamily)